MRNLFPILLSLLFLHSNAQNLEIIQNQWEAIAKAKTAEEKLMRNCRMGFLTGTSPDFDFKTGKISRKIDLNVIDGISDLIDEDYRVRFISRYFEIENNQYQYNYDFSCAGKRDSTYGYVFGMRACDNDHELSCKPCHLKHYLKDDWEGAYYTQMTTFYQDTMMYLKLKGEQYHSNDMVPVSHTFTVTPGCKIKFINETQ